MINRNLLSIKYYRGGKVIEDGIIGYAWVFIEISIIITKSSVTIDI